MLLQACVKKLKHLCTLFWTILSRLTPASNTTLLVLLLQRMRATMCAHIPQVVQTLNHHRPMPEAQPMLKLPKR